MAAGNLTFLGLWASKKGSIKAKKLVAYLLYELLIKSLTNVQ